MFSREGHHPLPSLCRSSHHGLYLSGFRTVLAVVCGWYSPITYRLEIVPPIDSFASDEAYVSSMSCGRCLIERVCDNSVLSRYLTLHLRAMLEERSSLSRLLDVHAFRCYARHSCSPWRASSKIFVEHVWILVSASSP